MSCKNLTNKKINMLRKNDHACEKRTHLYTQTTLTKVRLGVHMSEYSLIDLELKINLLKNVFK